MEPPEREILQLIADFLDAHAPRQRRINIHGLLRDYAPLLRLDEFNRAHIVEPVGELHEQDAHIARYGDQKLAKIFCLLGFF